MKKYDTQERFTIVAMALIGLVTVAALVGCVIDTMRRSAFREACDARQGITMEYSANQENKLMCVNKDSIMIQEK